MAREVRKTERTVLHVDCNAFYASVECLYHPELRTRPVAVGGEAEKRHGIILAKNQQAKICGVTTGEALWQARQKCPDLVILPPDYGKYIRFSRLCREIYGDYSPQVESFGLDECWLDVTGTPRLAALGPRLLAEEIRERVKEELGITVSVGVSYNKIFAKLGSDYRKPDAVTVFGRESMREKIWPIDVAELLYVGRATERKLRAFGVSTIGELALTPVEWLQGWFGKWGLMLHCFANGLDSSPVARTGEESIIKSIGNSTTTPRDLTCEQDADIIFWMLCESVAARLREGGFRCRTVQISLRTNELFCFERQMKLPEPTCLAAELHAAAPAKSSHTSLIMSPLSEKICMVSSMKPARRPSPPASRRMAGRRGSRRERMQPSAKNSQKCASFRTSSSVTFPGPTNSSSRGRMRSITPRLSSREAETGMQEWIQIKARTSIRRMRSILRRIYAPFPAASPQTGRKRSRGRRQSAPRGLLHSASGSILIRAKTQ